MAAKRVVSLTGASPYMSGLAPLGAQLASFRPTTLYLPYPPEKPLMIEGATVEKPVQRTKEEAEKIFLQDRKDAFLAVDELLKEPVVVQAVERFKKTYFFSKGRSEPKSPKFKSTFQEYMKNNNWWMKEDGDSRLTRAEMVNFGEPGTRYYEDERLKSFEKYRTGDYRKILEKIGVNPDAPFEPNIKVKDYATFLKDQPTYLDATVARFGCAIAWALVCRSIKDDPSSVKEGDFYDYIVTPNSSDEFVYFEGGLPKTQVVSDGLSGTARRTAWQFRGRVSQDGKLTWTKEEKQRLAKLMAASIDHESEFSDSVEPKDK